MTHKPQERTPIDRLQAIQAHRASKAQEGHTSILHDFPVKRESFSLEMLWDLSDEERMIRGIGDQQMLEALEEGKTEISVLIPPESVEEARSYFYSWLEKDASRFNSRINSGKDPKTAAKAYVVKKTIGTAEYIKWLRTECPEMTGLDALVEEISVTVGALSLAVDYTYIGTRNEEAASCLNCAVVQYLSEKDEKRTEFWERLLQLTRNDPKISYEVFSLFKGVESVLITYELLSELVSEEYSFRLPSPEEDVFGGIDLVVQKAEESGLLNDFLLIDVKSSSLQSPLVFVAKRDSSDGKTLKIVDSSGAETRSARGVYSFSKSLEKSVLRTSGLPAIIVRLTENEILKGEREELRAKFSSALALAREDNG